MYGHAAAIAALPPCPCGSGRPAWVVSEVTGGKVCGRCALDEEKSSQ